ncbi:hypothetical protein EPA93_23740 [Ktedonosporobacter rubrisoli]|uniref:Transposase DDE domain-containing protein n=1 Tax=Ktedonosporobacter rubrisoli TaxID=2509675 RepID=A0A4P6JU35_KTERU|nr:hypothetical protein [Ktedonosporobacter rubrisoli]QBD78833.1 hypothetical protein EPA93_23740 [Ktedonosporobacter rubrisoli]
MEQQGACLKELHIDRACLSSQWPGRRARYRGIRKDLFDLRRCGVAHTLHVLARSQPLQADLQIPA